MNRAFKDHKGYQVLEANKDLRVTKEIRETKEREGLLDLKVNKV